MRPGDGVGGGIGDRLRRVAGVGLQDDRVAEKRRVARDVGELAAELAVGQVQRRGRARATARRRPRRRSYRRCRARPRSPRAPRAARRCRRARGRRARGRASGGARCPAAAACSPARRASASGRTFEGPQPNRPSAGFRSAGIFNCVLVVMWADVPLFGGAGQAQARGVLRAAPPLPGGVLHPNASRDGPTESSEPWVEPSRAGWRVWRARPPLRARHAEREAAASAVGVRRASGTCRPCRCR